MTLTQIRVSLATFLEKEKIGINSELHKLLDQFAIHVTEGAHAAEAEAAHLTNEARTDIAEGIAPSAPSAPKAPQ
jgi:hypothetical protein